MQVERIAPPPPPAEYHLVLDPVEIRLVWDALGWYIAEAYNPGPAIEMHAQLQKVIELAEPGT